MDELRARLNELEIRYTHQELLLEELNGVVAEFGRRIIALERENCKVREMLGSLAPSTPESPDE